MNKEWIEVAAQIGGKDAFLVMQQHIQWLKQSFASVIDPISDHIQQLTYILRVDGNVRIWGLPSVSNIDLNLKERYVSVDIAIPALEWKKSDLELAAYIARVFTVGMHSVQLELKQAGLNVDENGLSSKLTHALRAYQRCVAAQN